MNAGLSLADPTVFGLGLSWHRVHINLVSTMSSVSSHLCINTKVYGAAVRYMMGINAVEMKVGRCLDLGKGKTLLRS